MRKRPRVMDGERARLLIVAVLVDVKWNGIAVLMFVTDLQQLGEIVRGAGS